PPTPTLFPYTTLFRSSPPLHGRLVAIENVAQHLPLTVHAGPRLHELPCVLDALPLGTVHTELVGAGGDRQVSGARYDDLGRLKRSEEHTSELQSLAYL